MGDIAARCRQGGLLPPYCGLARGHDGPHENAPDLAPATVGSTERRSAPATAARRAVLVVAYLAVITVLGYLTVGTYALSVVGFTVAVVAVVLGFRAIDVAVTRGLRRHYDNALNVTSLELYRARKTHPAGRRLG